MPINPDIERTLAAERVRDDFVPVSDYISADFQKLENERLWPKVWQVACREEEIPNVGDYITYEIANQSFIVIRSAPGKIRSLYNVCLHRGRRLTTGHGNALRLHCNYHGWQWNVDGSIARVLDREDWDGCGEMTDSDLQLRETLVDIWGGFVFINMDLKAEPLHKFLDPVPEYLDPYEYQKMRFRFYATFRLPNNWKVAQEAFDEVYHVAATHPQLLDSMGDDRSKTWALGKHGYITYPYEKAPIGAPSPRLNRPMPDDLRPGIIRFFDIINKQLPIYFTIRDGEAARRLMTEAKPDEPYLDLWMKTMQFQKEAAMSSGAGWPDITMEQMGKAGADWHIFPNLVTLPYPDGNIVYRARPDGDNSDSCIYDVWGLQRYAPGSEPELKRLQLLGVDDWKKAGEVSLILEQDFSNQKEVQDGMKSHGFPGCRTSPIQEKTITNMHRVLREEYLFPGV